MFSFTIPRVKEFRANPGIFSKKNLPTIYLSASFTECPEDTPELIQQPCKILIMNSVGCVVFGTRDLPYIWKFPDSEDPQGNAIYLVPWDSVEMIYTRGYGDFLFPDS